MRRRYVGLIAGVSAIVLICTGSAGPASAAGGVKHDTVTHDTVTHYGGTLADGASWIADIPSRWNGTMVLYSHGFGALSAADAPDPASQRALLAAGYALVGSSYDPNGSLWALASAARDQFASLAAVERIVGRPRLRLALGTSMGGLVSAQEAQTARGRLDGVVSTCGLVGGGVDLNNYELDGEYAITALLAPGQGIKLVDYASPADGVTAAAALSSVATAARASAAGRARVALGTALLNMPTFGPAQSVPPARTDADGQATAQYDWLVATLPFIMPARYFIEAAVGGNASWNVRVDYGRLLERSPYRREVETLYREAGLNLHADLARLTTNASLRASNSAVRALQRTSTVTGHLDVPVLDMHTIYDQLAPIEYENRYAAQVRAAGDGSLLRQAYVDRRGHCNFVPSEILASLRAIRQRIITGHWDDVATAAHLEWTARRFGFGDGPAFVPFRPGPLVSHRSFDPALDGGA